ncbi:MAG: circularly permuted type 2 ATP-grasp protein, partial [bacterium]
MLEDEAISARPHYQAYADWLGGATAESMAAKRAQADLIFRRIGITFSVYGDESGTERLIPSDVVPRIITGAEWARLRRGLVQRVTAINRFLADIYGAQEILRAGLIPEDQILANDQYQVAMIGTRVPHDIYAHIVGVD